MNELVTAHWRMNRQMLKEETLFEAVLGILAAAWCGFLWYLVAWLLL